LDTLTLRVGERAGDVLADARGQHAAQVAKITIYVVHHRPGYLPVIEAARAGLLGDSKPPDTVVG
jgi:hypothetical protein